MSRPGALITIEGLDGAGKTTLAEGLQSALAARGLDVQLLREPGGVPAAERVRELVKDPSLTVGARSEALLYAAARAQLVEEAVNPRLQSGGWVLLDRFIDSSLAYQGAGRGLGIADVRAINQFATGGLLPDRTLLLVVDPSVGITRARQRPGPLDRLELEDREFFGRVAAAYAELAAAEPHRIRQLDGSQAPETVLAEALAAIEDLVLSSPPGDPGRTPRHRRSRP